MDSPSLRSSVIALLAYARDQEESFLRDLTAAERDLVGGPDHPAAKVLLAHITEFKRQQVQKVAAAASGESPPRLEAVEPSDPVEYARLALRYWQQVEIEAARVFSALAAEVERLSDEELRDPHRFPWLNGRPLCRQVLGRGLWHPLTHLSDYDLARGEKARPARRHEMLAALVDRLAFVPVSGDGMSCYNLACAFAEAGEHDKALALVEAAIRTDPKYADYARDDPDLAPLRVERGWSRRSLLRRR